MKSFVIIFLTWGPILVQSNPIAENIDKKSELKLIKENLTHSPILTVNDTKVEEAELEVTKLDDSKFERSEDLNEDILKLKDESKLKDEVIVKKEFKLNDKLVLKDDLKFEKASDSICVDRAKKDCKPPSGLNTTPTKICFEVTPGVQGGVEVCKEDGSEFSNRPQTPQESQLGPQLHQEPQQVPQQHQINYEIPQKNDQVPQQNYGVPQLPASNNGPQQSSVQIPMTWCIQTDTGLQKFESVIQIDQQSPQGSEYQIQPQQFDNSQNIPSSYPQTPSGFPQNPSPQGSEYQVQPQQFSFSQNIQSSYPQNPSPQGSEYQIQPQQFTFSQNFPSSFPQNPFYYPQNPSPQGSEYQIQPQQFTFTQNIPSSYLQNPSGYPQNQSGSPQNQSRYSQNQSGYPRFRYSYSQNPPSYPQNPPSYPQNPPSYPQNPPSYPQNSFPAYPNLPSGYPQTPPNSYRPPLYPIYTPQTFSGYPQNFQCAPPQNCPCYCYQNLQSVFPQNLSPSFQIPPQPQQESFSQFQPQQQSSYSQNGPSSFPQIIFSGNSQIPAIYPQNQPNKFYQFSDNSGNNPQFEKDQPGSQGFLPYGGNQFGNQGGIQSITLEPSGGNFVQPTGAIPTAEGNSQSFQQQTPQNAIYLDARRVQPGPISRILDRPSSFQMSGRPGNLESSFEFQQRSQPQPSGRVEQAPFRIQL